MVLSSAFFFDKNHIPFEASIQQIKESYSKADGLTNFLKNCLKWSRLCGRNPTEKQNGSTEIHKMQANAFLIKKEYARAIKHFILADSPDDLSECLYQWGQQVYPSEKDLTITRGVLQLLTLGNLKDANYVFDKLLQKWGTNLPQTPLINFTKFLLLTLEREAYPLFQLLSQKYALSLDRDPNFYQVKYFVFFLIFPIELFISIWNKLPPFFIK